jgi:hypothetical protein
MMQHLVVVVDPLDQPINPLAGCRVWPCPSYPDEGLWGVATRDGVHEWWLCQDHIPGTAIRL